MVENIIVLNNARHMTTNVYHVYSSEVCQVMNIMQNHPNIYSVLVLDHDETNKCMVWRLRIIQAIFKCVHMFTLPSNIEEYKLFYLPAPNCFTIPFREFKYIPKNDVMIDFVKRIKSAGFGLPLDNVGTDVVFVQRRPPFRCLYDIHTRKPLQDVLTELMPKSTTFKVCFFEEMTVEEQAQTVSNAKCLICPHGAGLTNMIFLPDNATVIEYNFRKWWTCDPVCERHMLGEISYKEPCQAHPPVFHKADYYSLASMLNKRYIELPVEEMEERKDANPISWSKLFVDPDQIIEFVASL
jgi:hypothetical protein